MHASALLSFLSLALISFAEPLKIRDSTITLPIARRVNATGLAGFVQRDKLRAQFLKQGKSGSLRQASVVGSIPATDEAVDYTVKIQIGTPPTTYTLFLDTASANTWVSDVSYVETSTSVQSSNTFLVTYGGGEFASGTQFNDKLAISSSLVEFGQSIGVATDSEGFDGVDGVLGLGPTGLSVGTLSPATTQSIPTIVDTLFQQGVIPQDSVAISFEPSSTVGTVNGELTFGGTDSSKFTGSIDFTAITTTKPSNTFWGINQQIRYGTSTNILSATAGIIDAGTTLTLIATDALARYTQITGAVLDDNTGLLKISSSQFASLQSLFFVINGVTFEFTANAQLWPRALNTAIGGLSTDIFLIIGDIGSNSGSGLDFINGMTWMQRFYVVLDTTNSRVGIANTPFTRATSN
ncbi:acid protease [Cytidiella melzeri]|nr:acid protease [Cytidiella melzeri]